jgi:acyl-CoA synthetase (AMP-forming)/AMP-acid ligase II
MDRDILFTLIILGCAALAAVVVLARQMLAERRFNRIIARYEQEFAAPLTSESRTALHNKEKA